MPSLNRRQALCLGAAGLGAITFSGDLQSAQRNDFECSIHHDHVLGTSFDAWFEGISADNIETVERIALDEIERLRKIFGLHDPNSELSRLNRSHGPVAVSPDMVAVLEQYQHWDFISGGACNPGVGGMTGAWEASAKQGMFPRVDVLQSMARRISRGAFRLADGYVTVETDQSLNLNSVAKGYVLQRVSAVLRQSDLSIKSALLNLGGDMIAWGEKSWVLGIQDPLSPADNAEPLGYVSLNNASIATSGDYLRNYVIDGESHSHIIDPRTGYPSKGIAGATVIASDSVTANILATTLCVLGVSEGNALIEATAGASSLIVDSQGRQFRSAQFISFETESVEFQEPKSPIAGEKKDTKPVEKKDTKPGKPWPEDFEVKIDLELPRPAGGRARRPYVAIWIENSDGKAVRTVTVWGNSPRWINTMSGWWKIGKDNRDLVKAVSRATRSPGKYSVVWDGKDDAGKALPQGSYTIKIEVHREHGKDVTQSGKIDCLSETATLKLAENAETKESVVTYGKKEKKDQK